MALAPAVAHIQPDLRGHALWQRLDVWALVSRAIPTHVRTCSADCEHPEGSLPPCMQWIH